MLKEHFVMYALLIYKRTLYKRDYIFINYTFVFLLLIPSLINWLLQPSGSSFSDSMRVWPKPGPFPGNGPG